MKRIFWVCLFSCSGASPTTTSAPAASLVPVLSSAPVSLPVNVCAPTPPEKLSDVLGWSVFRLGASPEELKATFERYKLPFQFEESRGYSPSRVGEPVVHSTIVNISFTCDTFKGHASLNDALNKVSSLSVVQEDVPEREARDLMASFTRRFGEAPQHHELNYENIYRDDRCWTHDKVELCALMLSVKSETRQTWSVTQSFRTRD